MINLKITKYRDFTKEELEAREDYKNKFGAEVDLVNRFLEENKDKL